MGILDFLFKGPQLKKWRAKVMASNIAMDLYRNKYSLQDLIMNAEKILEHEFQRDREIRDCSIEPEQSKQILRLAILYYEHDKNYLEKLKQRQDRIRSAYPSRLNFGDNHIDPENIKYEEHLTLFKD